MANWPLVGRAKELSQLTSAISARRGAVITGPAGVGKTTLSVAALEWAQERGMSYSLNARRIEEDILPTCQRHGVGTMVYSPLGGGVLTGKYKKGETAPADSRGGRGGMWARMLDDRSLDLADEVGKVAAEVGATHTAAALAWVLARRGVTSVIIGPRTFEQYEQNMEGFDLVLDPELVKRLSDASRWAR